MKPSQTPKANLHTTLLAKSSDLNNNKDRLWMVIALKGKPGKEKGTVLVSGVSKGVASSYAEGFNDRMEHCAKTRVRAVICGCH